MTNEEFGRRIGVTHSMASRMRNGQRLPSNTVLLKIQSEFDLPLQELVNAHAAGAPEFGRLLRSQVFRPAAPAPTAVG